MRHTRSLETGSMALDETRMQEDMTNPVASSMPEISAERFFELVPEPLCCLAPRGSLVRLNPAFARLAGAPLAEILGQSFFDLVHPEDRPMTTAIIERAWSQASGLLIENRFGSGGSYRTISWSVSLDPDARLLYLAGHDVSERTLTEREHEWLVRQVETERSHLAGIVDASPTLMSIMDGPDHVFRQMNDPLLAYLGGRDAIGKPLREVIPEVAGQGYFEVVDEVYRTGEPFIGSRLPVTIETESGGPPEQRYLDLNIQPMRDGDGKVVGIIGQAVDQTEHLRATAALEASEEKYRGLFESIDQGFALCEVIRDEHGSIVDFTFLETNPAFTAITGFSPEQAIGHTIRELTPTVDRGSVILCASVVDTGRSVTFEDDVPEMGTWFEVSAYPRGGDRFAVMFTDTTARMRAEADRERLLREVEVERTRLAEAFEQAPSLIAVFRGPDHVIEQANALYRGRLGNRDVLSKPVRQALPELGEQGVIETLDRIYETGETFVEMERAVMLQPPTSEPPAEQYFDVCYQPMRDADGNVSGIIAQALDQTDRVRAEADLRDSEARYRTLFVGMDEGFCTIDLIFDDIGNAIDYRFVEINPAFERQSGIHDAVGKRMSEIGPHHEPFWYELYGRVALTGEPARFTRHAGELGDRWFDVNAFRLGGSDSRRVAAIFQDVTGRRHAEEERERHLGEAEEAIRARDVFLSIASHELRNPVTSIKAAAQLLQRTLRKGTLDATGSPAMSTRSRRRAIAWRCFWTICSTSPGCNPAS